MNLKRVLLGCLPIVLLFVVANAAISEELRVANIFTDNMVLQRNQEFSIWGWGNPSTPVTVKLQKQTATISADQQGRWEAKFKAIDLGDPFSIKISTAQKSIVLDNVLAGDVWICSGQSNMEWEVRQAGNPQQEIAQGNWPLIRHVRVDHVTSPSKLDDVNNSGWKVCTPETVGNFSAVGYYFARELQRELNVPIGLLHTSWGGTIIETWISPESLKNHPDFTDAITKLESVYQNPKQQEARAKQLDQWNQDFRRALEDKSTDWKAPALDDSDWISIKAPGSWESQGYQQLDGIAWYRRTITLPDSWKSQPASISLGQIDDIDITYVNGVKIGSVSDWTKLRKYEIPANLLKAGKNSIAIRVTDQAGGGGIIGDPNDMRIARTGEPAISLAGKWKFKKSDLTRKLGERPEQPFRGPNHPTLLSNAMVNPFLLVKAKGVIWYQGESNAGRAFQYRSLMPLLIQDWRNRFGQDFSFYWVQLANFTMPRETPGDSQWAELREAQTMALTVPKTGQAVIIDIGEARDIHPKNKQDVGKRLALNALAKDYKKSVVYSGPMFKSVEFSGNRATVHFDHATGLISKNGPLKHFQIAGKDKKFVWADAKIEGNSVVVSSELVKDPASVRYAWADNPEGCNLYNAAGLPACPFRTDTWKGVTQNE
ncbi:MAG: 9-O-acetylesterase [Planctomycetaceae bacterium]|nr:9-O-acetylesterase [Planctomycetaceae bacterium]